MEPCCIVYVYDERVCMCITHSAHAIACVSCIAYDANESLPCDKMTLENKCRREGKDGIHKKMESTLLYTCDEIDTAVYVYNGEYTYKVMLIYCILCVWIYRVVYSDAYAISFRL